MAAGRQYKNAYTILEKVKKGEIDSYYRNEDSLFSKINFYKKPDLINPHLHYIDESRLKRIVSDHMVDQKMVTNLYESFHKGVENKKLPTDKQPGFNSFYEKFQENYTKFPKHLSNDIFKMYYNQMEKLNFEDRNNTNTTKFKILEKANNPVGKIMSENSSLKSAIFTRNVVSYFVGRMTIMDFIEPETSEDFKNDINGDGDSGGEDGLLDKMMNSKQASNDFDKTIQDAQDLCNKMDGAMDEETQQQMFDNILKGGNQAGKISPEYLNKMIAKLENITLSMDSVKNQIKKLVDKSVSYFSAKKITIYEDLFNSDNIAGLDEFELLHPKIRKIFAEDLQIKSTKSIGKIDIYIDISGSMSSKSGTINKDGNPINKLEFCKAFAAKLKQMDMLNNIYTFNTKVNKIKNNMLSISMIDDDGGTDIDTVIKSIEANKENALVLTDAEDRCNLYSDKAYFIGVKGARFSYFKDDVIKEYSQKDQVIVFDGTKISKVDTEGEIVKEYK
jgi:hypothetical protein